MVMNIFKHLKNIVSGTDDSGDNNMGRITRSTGAGKPSEDKPASKSVAKKAKKAEVVEEVVEEVAAVAPVVTPPRLRYDRQGRLIR